MGISQVCQRLGWLNRASLTRFELPPRASELPGGQLARVDLPLDGPLRRLDETFDRIQKKATGSLFDDCGQKVTQVSRTMVARTREDWITPGTPSSEVSRGVISARADMGSHRRRRRGGNGAV